MLRLVNNDSVIDHRRKKRSLWSIEKYDNKSDVIDRLNWSFY